MDSRKTLILVGIAAVALALGAAAVSGAIGNDGEPTQANAPQDDPDAPSQVPLSEAPDDGEETDEEDLPRDHPGVLLDTFESDVPEDLETGELNLRVDQGHVQVIGWDQPAYKVMVLQDEVPENRIHDHETNIEFDDASTSDHFDLTVLVDRESPHNLQANSDGKLMHGDDIHVQIVAYVPDTLHYETIHACSGQGTFLHDAFQELGELVDARSGYEACMPASGNPGGSGSIHVSGPSDEREIVERASSLENLQGDTARLDMRYSSIGLDDLTVENVTATTRYGPMDAQAIDAENLALATRYGPIEIADSQATNTAIETRDGNITADLQSENAALETRYGTIDAVLDADQAALATRDGNVHVTGTVETLTAEARYGTIEATLDAEQAHLATRDGDVTLTGAAENITAETRYGDVVLTLEEARTGSIETSARDGAITVELPRGSNIGYDVKGTSDQGDVIIDLEDAQTLSSQDEDEDTEHARTNGFDNKPIQVVMNSETRYGDIHIAQGPIETPDEAQDEESDSSEDDPVLGAEPLAS